MTQPRPSQLRLTELPAVKWRCQFCKAAYQELQAFSVRGEVELGLKCHRCGRTGVVKKDDGNGR